MIVEHSGNINPAELRDPGRAENSRIIPVISTFVVAKRIMLDLSMGIGDIFLMCFRVTSFLLKNLKYFPVDFL